MKRTLVVAIVVFVGLLAYFPYRYYQKEIITNFPSANTGIVAFGDSLVLGVGSTQNGGFVKMLSDELGVTITNLGRSGDTTAKALERVDVVTQLRPAITILLLGGNDYLQQVLREETISNLEKIIEKIHQSGSAVLLVGMESSRIGNQDREIFEDLAAQYKTAYAPHILSNIYGSQSLMSDSLHPNDAGYRLMAERIKPVLVRLISN